MRMDESATLMPKLAINKTPEPVVESSKYPDPTPPQLLVSIDIETLALGPRPVITQIALLGYDLEEDEHLDARHSHYYPIEPQQQIIPARKISASTLSWWMKQSDVARERFELSTATDFEDLKALCRNLITVFKQLTAGKDYRVLAKGPQFDIVAIETLLEEVGLEVPWVYDRVFDLRTYLHVAGISGQNVPKPAGTIPHVAYWDALWQIEQYLACKRALAGRA